ncbi:MAG: ATP-binding protein [Pseudomonadota bacterium]
MDTSQVLPGESNVKLSVLRAACDHAADVIILANADGSIIYVNRAITTLLGYTADEVMGRSVRELIDQEDWPDLAVVRQGLLTAEIDKDISDRRYVAKDGSRVLASSALSSIRRSDGKVDYIVGFIRDVRKEREISENLKKALIAAEEATRLKSEFLANMSHEIRTPLNGVFGMAQALQNSDLTSEQEEFVGILIDSGQTLLTLLNDILDLSKIEAGKLELAPVEADIRHKLHRISAVHETVASEKGLDFKLMVSPAVPSTLLFDPIRFRQCIDNLVSNAIKFTAKGHIVLSVTSEDLGHQQHKILVAISDSGEGIPEEKQQQIFQAFQQADASTSRRHGGTGLGLAITRKLATLMGGDITLSSTPGEGSTFTLEIVAEAVKSTHGSILIAEKKSSKKRSSAILPKEMRILVADDNEVNLRVVDLFLTKHGVKTVHAKDGEEVLHALETKGRFDLVLLDIHMPKMDGVEAFKRMRSADQAWSETPVIALTAEAMASDREKYLSMGMQGYLSKPVQQRELLSEIAKYGKSEKDRRQAS